MLAGKVEYNLNTYSKKPCLQSLTAKLEKEKARVYIHFFFFVLFLLFVCLG